METNNTLNLYDKDEVKKLLHETVRLVYFDNGSEEFIARYEDIPDIIVDINNKFGSMDLKVYDFETPDMDNPLLSTFGPFLNKCDQNARKDIIDRLADLQLGNIEIKDYKVIDEDMYNDIENEIEEMER